MKTDAGVRVDSWLWAARFFKTRSLCRQAIDGGKIEVNDSACKPSRLLNPGDTLRVSRGDERYEIEVLAVAAKRSSAALAQTLYRETQASLSAREAQHELRRLTRSDAPARRPDKQDRRALLRLRQRN